MKTKHTPGPWKANNDCQIQCENLNSYGNWIVASITRENTPEDHANARLIALSPEMISELQNARIALTFYREWMQKQSPGTDYPFGIKVEKTVNEIILKASDEK